MQKKGMKSVLVWQYAMVVRVMAVVGGDGDGDGYVVADSSGLERWGNVLVIKR
jgi:hypothetical protein